MDYLPQDGSSDCLMLIYIEKAKTNRVSGREAP
jgi:hypothetical protein